MYQDQHDMHGDIFGAREAGLKTGMFDSDQGKKAYRDCVPDYTITDLRDLLKILGICITRALSTTESGLGGRVQA